MSDKVSLRCLLVGPLREPAGLVEAQAERTDTVAEALARLGADTGFDAVVLDGDALSCTADEMEALTGASGVLVALADADAEHALAWLRRGADDVLGAGELASPVLLRRLRFAVERRARQATRLHAYATDLATGLPHRQQLIEHLSQLLALREREPAPMALLALRIEGLAAVARSSGEAAAEALRRKLAVRLRSGLRASDVVAAVEGDVFVVLLGSLLGPADADRVAAKLAAALGAPLTLEGIGMRVAIAVGVARFPEDGSSADKLLRRALALAHAAPVHAVAEAHAANDESASPG